MLYPNRLLSLFDLWNTPNGRTEHNLQVSNTAARMYGSLSLCSKRTALKSPVVVNMISCYRVLLIKLFIVTKFPIRNIFGKG